MVNVYRVDILEEKLRELTERMPGIRGTLISSIEGFVVAAYSPAEDAEETSSSPQIAAMAATLIALGEQTLSRLKQGDIERLMVEGQDGAMIVYPINQNAALAAMVDKDAKMGLTLLTISRAAAFFASILSGPA